MADRKTQSAKESKKVQRAQEASVINSLIRECEQGSAAILQERRRHSISSSYKKASRRPLAKNMSTAVAESSRQSLKAEAESINALVGGGLSAVRRRRKLTGASKHSVAKAAEPRQDRTARDVVEPAPPPAGAAGAAGRPSASQDAYAFLEAECTWWQRKYEKLEIENADLLDQVEALQCMLRDGGQGRRPSSFMRRSGDASISKFFSPRSSRENSPGLERARGELSNGTLLPPSSHGKSDVRAEPSARGTLT